MTRIEEYTPCRIYECFLDENEVIEVASSTEILHLTGALKSVWNMLDGHHTIKCIVHQLGVQLNTTDYISLQKELIIILKQLANKHLIIINWDPIYKFDICQELPPL